jgi:hypothetical protein
MQWDVRYVNRWFCIRVRDHQRGSRWCGDCLWRNGRRLSGCMVLTITCLQKDFFLTSEEDGEICGIVWVDILAQLRWGRLHVLLGVHQTLVWNGIM